MQFPDGGPQQAMRTRRRTALDPPTVGWIVGSIGIGAVLSVLAATGSGARSGEVAPIALLAVLGAALVAVLGALVARRMRSRSLAVQVAVIVLIELGATLVGVVAATRAMGISGRDLWTMAVVVLAAGTVALVAALVLADRLGRASVDLANLAVELTETDDREVVPPANLPAELAEVADRLTDTWAQLQVARARDQVVDGSRRELVAWVSHDLSLPLLGIRSLIEALEAGMVTDPTTIARYHQSIGRDAERLSQLVDDLHDLTRVQVGSLQVPPERIEITGLVADGIAAISLAAEARGVAVRRDCDGIDQHVIGSATDLALVIANLLDIAIRHTHRGGEVTVIAAADDIDVTVTVRSSAGQLPLSDEDPGFDLAFGTGGETTGGAPPVGVDVAPVVPGLAVARKLVEAHRGELAVANDPDGCRLRLRLPLDP